MNQHLNQLNKQDVKCEAQKEAFVKILRAPNRAMADSEKTAAIRALAVGDKAHSPALAFQEWNHASVEDGQKHFEQVTAVQHVVDEHMKPILKEFKKVVGIASTNRTSIQDYQQKMQDMEMTIKKQDERFHVLVEMREDISHFSGLVRGVQGQFDGLVGSVEMTVSGQKAKIAECVTEIEVFHNRMGENDQRYWGIKEQMSVEASRMIEDTANRAKEWQYVLQETNLRIAQVQETVERNDKRFDELKTTTIKSFEQAINKTYKQLSNELLRLDKHTQLAKHLDAIDNKVNALKPQVSQLMTEMRQVSSLPQFIEHSLPLWMLYETSEFITEIFGRTPRGKDAFTAGVAGSNHLLKIISYENRKLNEILDYNEESKGRRFNMARFTACLYSKAKHYAEKQQGVLPFKMGQDYYASIPDEEVNSVKHELLQGKRDQGKTLKQTENRMQMALVDFDNIELEAKTPAHRRQKISQFQANIRDFQPIQIIQLWSYILTKKVTEKQTDIFFEALATAESVDALGAKQVLQAADLKSLSNDWKRQKLGSQQQAMKSAMKGGFQAKIQTKLSSIKPIEQDASTNNHPNPTAAAAGGPTSAVASEQAGGTETVIVQSPQNQPQPSDSANQGHQQHDAGTAENTMAAATTSHTQNQPSRNQAANPYYEEYTEYPEAPHPEPQPPQVILYKSMHQNYVRKGKIYQRNTQRQIKQKYKRIEQQVRNLHLLFPKEILSLEQQMDRETMGLGQVQKELERSRIRAAEAEVGSDIFSNLGRSIQMQDSIMLTQRTDQRHNRSVSTARDERFEKTIFERKMKMRQIENARPQQIENSEEFNQKQIEKIQEMIDQNIDWDQVYMKTAINNHMNDMWDQFEELKENLLAESKRNEHKVIDCVLKVEEHQAHTEEIRRDYGLDHTELHKFKQRLNSNLREDVTKIVEMVNASYENVYKTIKSIDVNTQAIDLILESSMITSMIQAQEVNDKKNLKLQCRQGIPGVNQAVQHTLGIPGKVQKGLALANAKNNVKVVIGASLQSQNQKDSVDTLVHEAGPSGQAKPMDNEVKDFRNVKDKDADRKFTTLMFDKYCSSSADKKESIDMLNQVKEACLCYIQAPVMYRGASTTVDQLVNMKQDLLKRCQDVVKWKEASPEGQELNTEVQNLKPKAFKFNLVDNTAQTKEQLIDTLVNSNDNLQSLTSDRQFNNGENANRDGKPNKNEVRVIHKPKVQLPKRDTLDISQPEESSSQNTMTAEASPTIRISTLNRMVQRDQAEMSKNLKETLIKESELFSQQMTNCYKLRSQADQMKLLDVHDAPKKVEHEAAKHSPGPPAKGQGKKNGSDSFKIQSLISKNIDESMKKHNHLHSQYKQAKLQQQRQDIVNNQSPSVAADCSREVEVDNNKRVISQFKCGSMYKAPRRQCDQSNDVVKDKLTSEQLLELFMAQQSIIQRQRGEFGNQEIHKEERNKLEKLFEFQNNIQLQNQLVQQIYADSEIKAEDQKVHSRQSKMGSSNLNQPTDIQSCSSKRNKTGYGMRSRNARGSLGESLELQSIQAASDVYIEGFEMRPLQAQASTIVCNDLRLKTLRHSSQANVPNAKRFMDFESHRGSQQFQRQNVINIKKTPIAQQRRSIFVNQDTEFKRQGELFSNTKINNDAKVPSRNAFTSLGNYEGKSQNPALIIQVAEKTQLNVAKAWPQPSPIPNTTTQVNRTDLATEASRPNTNKNASQCSYQSNRAKLSLMRQSSAGETASVNETCLRITHQRKLDPSYDVGTASPMPLANKRYGKQAVDAQARAVNLKFNTDSKPKDLSQISGKLKMGSTSHYLRDSPNKDGQAAASGLRPINGRKQQNVFFGDTLASRKLKAAHQNNEFEQSDYTPTQNLGHRPNNANSIPRSQNMKIEEHNQVPYMYSARIYDAATAPPEASSQRRHEASMQRDIEQLSQMACGLDDGPSIGDGPEMIGSLGDLEQELIAKMQSQKL